MVVPVSKVLESRTVTVGEECRVKLGHCIYPSAKILAIGMYVHVLTVIYPQLMSMPILYAT
jgi:hypothetical protein